VCVVEMEAQCPLTLFIHTAKPRIRANVYAPYQAQS
jgi:hypothetical protein